MTRVIYFTKVNLVDLLCTYNNICLDLLKKFVIYVPYNIYTCTAAMMASSVLVNGFTTMRVAVLGSGNW